MRRGSPPPSFQKRTEEEETYRNQRQAAIQRKEQSPPPSLTRSHQCSAPLHPQHRHVELNRQPQKHHDEKLLQPNAPHIDMNALQLLRRGRRTRGHATANELYDKGDEIQRDEIIRQGRRADAEQRVRRQEEVDHAPENHVVKGVDPERRQEHQQLGDEGEAGALLVARAQRARGEGDGFP